MRTPPLQTPGPGPRRAARLPAAVRRRHGFTLIELLAVLAVMLVVLSMTVFSVIDWSRATGMRASLQTIERGLAMARQQAMAQRERTVFVCSPPDIVPGAFTITNALGLIGETNYLRQGIAFAEDGAEVVCFEPRGDVRGEQCLILREANRGANAMTATVRVDAITGESAVER